MRDTFDVVVVGAGSAGLTSAVGLSKIGKKVLLIEQEHMGGECTNSGCIPSKALLHHAKQYYAGIVVAGKTASSETFRQEAFTYVRNKIAEILNDETPEHFRNLGIDVALGEGIFTSPRSIKVAEAEYFFRKAIIATGSQPRPLFVPGLAPERVLTNQNVFL
jgi:pyruvate/2-oxoglutarate dehydrogenase complex dihydrolipoamide dehydrogenase (E3) component